MKVYLEHANITFADLDGAVAFFQTAFPEFKIRGGGGEGLDRWLHVGTEDTYVALSQGHAENPPVKDYNRQGYNHIGFIVEDVEALAQRLLNKGYERSYPKTVQKFRIREYFFDHEGNDYEFVQYLSDKKEEQNDYSE